MCLESYQEKQKDNHDKAAWMMWHGVSLRRSQKMNPLADYLSSKKEVKSIDEDAIMERLKAYKKRYNQQCQ